MFRPAEPNSFRAERDSVFDLLGHIGISAHAERAEFVRPLHQFGILSISLAFLWIERSIHQHLHYLRRRGGDFSGKDFSRSSIDRDVISSI